MVVPRRERGPHQHAVNGGGDPVATLVYVGVVAAAVAAVAGGGGGGVATATAVVVAVAVAAVVAVVVVVVQVCRGDKEVWVLGKHGGKDTRQRLQIKIKSLDGYSIIVAYCQTGTLPLWLSTFFHFFKK